MSDAKEQARALALAKAEVERLQVEVRRLKPMLLLLSDADKERDADPRLAEDRVVVGRPSRSLTQTAQQIMDVQRAVAMICRCRRCRCEMWTARGH